ncbi:MAG: IclR family transcriptional regulator [Desulfosalsimonas sp.]
MSVQSVERALKILTLFSHRQPVLGISELSRMMDLPKGTVHGLIRTLVKHGFLKQDEQSRKYRLGLKIHELGIVLSGTLELNQKAAGPCHQLSRRTGLLSRLGIWDGGSVVITLNTHPHPMPVLPHQVGPRIHAYCSAIGKAILAFLDEKTLNQYIVNTRFVAFTPSTITSKKKLREHLKTIRRQGFSIDREEAVLGMGCIGAPIFDRQGAVAGAISLSGSISQVPGDNVETLSRELLSTAFEISRFLGYMPDIMESEASRMQTTSAEYHQI